MQVEIRSATEVKISGYVNAVERDSKVLPKAMASDADGEFVEKIQAGAFSRAISNNPDVKIFFNHERKIGGVSEGNLHLTEDNIGLHAEALIADEEVVNLAKRNMLTGWSFGFTNAKAKWEQYGDLKRRTITDLELREVSILTKTPAYIATSVELRGDNCTCSETRGCEDTAVLTGNSNCDSTIDYAKEIEVLELSEQH